MPAPVQYSKHRQQSQWIIRETRFRIFHLEPPLHEDSNVKRLIEAADDRHILVRNALGLNLKSKKEQELLAKINWWFYRGEILRDLGCTMHGAANSAGIHAAVLDNSWNDLDDMMNHEEIHWLWGRRVGEAPSLLNEGVAAYVERLLRPHRLAELDDGWHTMAAMASQRVRFLSLLASNDGFWRAHRERKPVYEVGGQLSRYIAEQYSFQHLSDIFLRTFYDDDQLPQVIEHVLGVCLDDVESAISEKY